VHREELSSRTSNVWVGGGALAGLLSACPVHQECATGPKYSLSWQRAFRAADPASDEVQSYG